MRLENDEGLPWTASTDLGWIVLLVALTCGTALIALSIYLALWIYTKGRSILPLVYFVLSAIFGFAGIVLSHWARLESITDILASVDSILWIAATFSLRHEIVKHYRESEKWEIRIGPWFTLFFSSVYINYRLNPFSFTPPPKDTLISLNLSTATNSVKSANSAKIDQ
jgi:hypothetical protein